jgi:hypothetical protein
VEINWRKEQLQGAVAVCLLAICGASSPALAHSQNSEKISATVTDSPIEEQARWLMTQMALRESLLQIPAQINMGLKQAKSQGMPADLVKLMERSGREVYDPKQLEPQALALLVKTQGRDHLQAWVSFYKTPIGQKMSAADIRGASPQVIGSVMGNASKIMAELAADTVRMALIQSVVDATKAVDRAVSMNMAMSLAMEWGVVSSMPEQPGKPTFRQLQDHVVQQRFVMRSQVSQFVLAHAAHMHKHLTLAELQQILVEANTPAGQALDKDFGQAYEHWINHYANRLGQSVSQSLKKRGV